MGTGMATVLRGLASATTMGRGAPRRHWWAKGCRGGVDGLGGSGALTVDALAERGILKFWRMRWSEGDEFLWKGHVSYKGTRLNYRVKTTKSSDVLVSLSGVTDLPVNHNHHYWVSVTWQWTLAITTSVLDLAVNLSHHYFILILLSFEKCHKC